MLSIIPNIILIVAALLGLAAAPTSYFAKKPKWVNISAIGQIFIITFLFILHIYNHASSNFQVINVFLNSHSLKPMLYKISGSWGNHEGSMLMWVFLLCVVNLTALISFKGKYSPIIALNCLIISLFVIFIFGAANPFTIFPKAPSNGMGLNPLLQDIGLAMHPPILYLGYGLTLLPFTAMLYLLDKSDWDIVLVKLAKTYSILALGFLTLGIGLGSWWAYRELGWGGFWFWDPVENLSLMPWLGTISLAHSLITLQNRKMLLIWSSFIAILTFNLSLLGTFLVRSGVITSVHSFASDPTRGIFILIILALIALSSFSYFTYRSTKLENKLSGFSLLSTPGLIMIANLVLLCLIFIVVLGTIFPIIYELATGQNITIGQPYYESIFLPFGLPILALMTIAPLISWKNGSFEKLILKYYKSVVASSLIMLATVHFTNLEAPIPLVALFLTWILTLSLLENLWLTRQNITIGKLSMFIAHMGFALCIFGITITTSFGSEKEVTSHIGQEIHLSKFTFVPKTISYTAVENYLSRKIYVNTTMKNQELGTLVPENRYYPIEDKTTNESSIINHYLDDVYIAIGNFTEDKFVLRIYYRPYINLIWAGVIMIFAACLLNIRSVFRK